MSTLYRTATIETRAGRSERAKDYGVEAEYGDCLETATIGNAESAIARGLMHMHTYIMSARS